MTNLFDSDSELTELSDSEMESELSELGDDPSEQASVAGAMEGVALGESSQTQQAAMATDPPVQTSYTDKLGVVVQTSFNVAHFGDTLIPRELGDDFDPDSPPPKEDVAATKEFERKLKIYNEYLKEAKKQMKIDAILAALKGAELNGHPIDIASFHEVNKSEEFIRMLLERGDAFGLDIKDGNATPAPDSGYVMAHGPKMITGTAKNNQKEHYPLVYNADKFSLESVQYIFTYGPKRGQLTPVPASGQIKVPRGQSRPIIVYTLESKEKDNAPPLNVGVVHTKPIGGGMNFDEGKDRREIFNQVRDAYQTAKDDAENNHALWTFIGDHYLANDDLADATDDKKSVEEVVDEMGLVAIDPVANTNTTDKIDRGLHPKNQLPEKPKDPKNPKKKQLWRPSPLRPKGKPADASQDFSGASFLDRNMAQVADKAVVTDNLVVAHGGIVPPRLPGTGPFTNDDLQQMNAGQFFDSDADNQELARILLVSDHSMFVLVTSDDADDEDAVQDMFVQQLDNEPARIDSILDPNVDLSDTGSRFPTPENSDESESDSQGSAESDSNSDANGSEDEDSVSGDAQDDDAMDEDADSPAPAAGALGEGRKRRRSESDEEGEGGSSSEPQGYTHSSANAGGRSITLAFRSGSGGPGGSHKRHHSSAGRR